MITVLDSTRTPDATDISTAVRPAATTVLIRQWRTSTETLAHVVCPSDFGTAFQKGSGPELVSFAKANYARKDMDTRFVSGGAIMCAGVCVY